MERIPDSPRHESFLSTEDLERLSALIVRAGISGTPLENVAMSAASYYKNGDEYHVLEHMFDVATGVLDECDEDESISPYERTILFLAALYHDAGYHVPLAEPYTSKEHRSASIAYKEIMGTLDQNSRLNAWQTFTLAGDVASLILSTEGKHDIGYNKLKMILNKVDLGNIRGPRSEMLVKSARIFMEDLREKGETTCGSLMETILHHQEKLDDWCNKTREVVTNISRVKRLTGLDENIAQIQARAIMEEVSKLKK